MLSLVPNQVRACLTPVFVEGFPFNKPTSFENKLAVLDTVD
jgi:hypothetical protein